MFDGKTLKGWEGDEKVFRVNRAIVGGNLKQGLPDNQFICTTREFKNFKLRAKCKLIGKNANGGIQFRSQRVPKSSEMIGYRPTWTPSGGATLRGVARNKVLTGPTPEQRKKIVLPDGSNNFRSSARGPRSVVAQ